MLWTDVEVKKGAEWLTGTEARAYVQTMVSKLVRVNAQGTVVLDPTLTGKGPFVTDDVKLKLELTDLLGVDKIRFKLVVQQGSSSDRVARRATLNVVDVKITYEVELKLGDLDALFPPIPTGSPTPWTDVGVKQRMQVLGYLYTGLAHPKIAAHAEKCWEYYRKVHSPDPLALISHDAAMAKLTDEVRNNVVCSGLPTSGEVFVGSDLPPIGSFAAIRFPGGYATTLPPLEYYKSGSVQSGTNKYEVGIGQRRDDHEKVIWADNPLLGKIPLVATVYKRIDQAPRVPVAKDELDVYFQLVDPAPLPAFDSGEPLRAPALRNTVMNFATGGLSRWTPSPPDIDGITPSQSDWDSGKKKAAEIARQADAEAVDAKRELQDAEVGLKKVEAEYQEAFTKRGELEEAKKTWLSDQLKDESAEFQRTKQAHDDEWGKRPHQSKAFSELDVVEKQAFVAFRDVHMKPFKEARDDAQRALSLKSGAVNKTPWPRQAELDDAWKLQKDKALEKTAAQERLKLAKEGLSDAIKRRRTELAAGESPSTKYVIDTANGADLASEPNPVLLRDDGVAEVTGAGQKRFTDDVLDKVAKELDPKDPQRFNAPSKWAGKGGAALLGSVFEAGERTGFHDGHAKLGTFAPASAASADTDPHAVKTKTNDLGNAGVIFTPSACGGDRYRLCVYVRPKTPGPSYETKTGTLVVWRNIRLYKHYRLSNTAVPPALATVFSDADRLGAANPGAKPPPPYTLWADAFGAKTGLSSGAPLLGLMSEVEAEYPPNNPTTLMSKHYYRPVPHTFISLKENLRRGYCDLVCDFKASEPLTQVKLDAMYKAFKDAYVSTGAVAAAVDWDLLGFVDETSPFLMNFRHIDDYNERVVAKYGPDGAFGPLEREVAQSLMRAYAGVHGIQPIAEVLMEGGVLPGFTIVQAVHGDTWDHRGFNIQGMFTSGWAQATRGAFVFYSNRVHLDSMCYSATSNTAHELGHALMLPHQSPNPGGDDYMHEPQVPTELSKPTVEQTNCVMGYSGCYGEFCGRCLLSLRGWRVKTTTWGDPIAMQNPLGPKLDGA